MRFLPLVLILLSGSVEERSAEEWMAALTGPEAGVAVRELAELGEDALPVLEACMGAEEDAVAWQAQRVYARLQPGAAKRGAKVLEQLATDGSLADPRRAVAALALGRMGLGEKTLVRLVEERPLESRQIAAVVALQLVGNDGASALKRLRRAKDPVTRFLAVAGLANTADDVPWIEGVLASVLKDRDSYDLYQVAVHGLERAGRDAAEHSAVEKAVGRERDRMDAGLMPDDFFTDGKDCSGLLIGIATFGAPDPDFRVSCPERFADFNGDGAFGLREFQQGYARHLAEELARFDDELERDIHLTYLSFSHEFRVLAMSVRANAALVERLHE